MTRGDATEREAVAISLEHACGHQVESNGKSSNQKVHHRYEKDQHSHGKSPENARSLIQRDGMHADAVKLRAAASGTGFL
jgi:hypothetical protein